MSSSLSNSTSSPIPNLTSVEFDKHLEIIKFIKIVESISLCVYQQVSYFQIMICKLTTVVEIRVC